MKHFKRIVQYALLAVAMLHQPALGQTTTQIAELVASDGAVDDYFGVSVSLSSDGSTAIIGAFYSTVSSSHQGSAYIYARSGNMWVQQARLIAGNATNGDNFGRAVSISSDGSTAVVGAANKTSGNNSAQGAAYIFTRNGTTWAQQTKLIAADSAAYDNFGNSVSISGDGNTVIIGAGQKNEGNNYQQGAAYVYNRSGSTWAQQAKLTAADGTAADHFGQSVSLSNNGNLAIVGASSKSVGSNSYQGAAYTYIRNNGIWAQQAKLTAGDGANFDYFGQSVSLSSDGNTAIVGADNKAIGSNYAQGAAYVYSFYNGTWAQQARLTASNGVVSDNFGRSVSLGSNGNIAIVGASSKKVGSNDFQGEAYTFTRSGSTWVQQAILTAGDGAVSDDFGYSVSLGNDGNIAFIGADDKTVGNNEGQGVTYVFAPGCTTTGLAQPATGQALASSQTLTVAGSAQTTFQAACATASGLLPNGASPVSGSVTSKVWVEASELTIPTGIYTRRHCEITPATNAATATARVTLYSLQSEFDSYNGNSSQKLPTGPTDAAGIARLRIYKYSGTSSNGTGLPGSYGGTPAVIDPADADIVWNSSLTRWEISFDVTGFSGFFTGAAGAVTLPVKLAGFTAAKQAGNSLLIWQVAQEENINAYSIERSADGYNFTAVGSVTSLGNTTASRSYSFTDAAPLKGANYYRLKIVERDGRMSYSEVRLLNFDNTISIALYPNPAKDKATLTGVEAGMSIRLLDAIGKVLQVQTATGTTETMRLSNLSKGLYSLQVYSTEGQLLSTARLVKE